MTVETVCVCENNCADCEKCEMKQNIEARSYRRCFENENKNENQNQNKYTDIPNNHDDGG